MSFVTLGGSEGQICGISRTSRVVLSGVLPAPRASRGKHNFIRRFNTFCTREGYRFTGDPFWDRAELLKRDGLHLNRRGTFALGQRMLSVAQDCLNWRLGVQGG